MTNVTTPMAAGNTIELRVTMASPAMPPKATSDMASRLNQLVRHPSQTRQAFVGCPR